jgi:hypothetical protein
MTTKDCAICINVQKTQQWDFCVSPNIILPTGLFSNRRGLNTSTEHSLCPGSLWVNIHISTKKLWFLPTHLFLVTDMLCYHRDHFYFRTAEMIVLDHFWLKLHIYGMSKTLLM